MMPAAARRKRDPIANREDQRRHRKRLKKCQRSYRVDLDGPAINMLVRRRYLDDDEANDDAAVGLAVSVFMRDHAEIDE
jgi:hypothetical protein